MKLWTPSGSTLVGWTPTSKMATPLLDTNPCFSPRSEQKTSGLFDTEKADCVGHSMTTTYNLADIDDAWKIFEGLEDDINTLDFGLSKEDQTNLGDLSIGLAESDFLDSFIDLSNFVTENASEEKPDELSEVFNTDTTSKTKIEFTSVIVDNPDPVFPATSTNVGKRKHSAIESMSDTANVVDVNTYDSVSTFDHDYVSKKPRLSPVIKGIDMALRCTVSTDVKYRERRDKNNVASKRSREIRKNKYKDMEKEAEELVAKNDSLRMKIVELEKLANEMKTTLIKKMTAH